MADGLLRELHSLKGEAGLLGFSAVSDVAHALEDLVGEVAKSGQTPDPEIGDLVLDAFDLIANLSEREPGAAAPEAEGFLAQLPVFSGLSEDDDDGVDDIALLDESRPIADIEPPAAPAPVDEPDSSFSDYDSVLLEASEELDLPALEESPSPSSSTNILAPPIPSDIPRRATSYSVRVNPKQLDQIRDIIGELLLTRTRLDGSAAALHRQRHGQSQIDDEFDTEIAGPDATSQDELLRSIEGQLRDDVLRMSSLVNALDEVTRELRMVSIGVLFDRYPMAVRSLSRQLGRRVQLVCQGEAMEADRDVLQALDDPLLHLVRNALDHGIEPPEERERAGKLPTGTLTLSASVTGDTLCVEIRDDGAGIDLRHVRQTAIERGVVDAGTARTMNQRQILRCLFEPGMSTRNAVDQVSGRGVGLDVVQKTVRNLGGSVEVSTELGVGTAFTLSVPIRASITSVFLFRVGNGWYALPTSALVAVEELDDYPIAASIDGPALHYKEGLVPLVALEPVLGEPKFSTHGGRRGARVIITRYNNMLFGLTGSYGHLQREAVLKPVSSLLREDKLIIAGLALEDGQVALVINPGEIFKITRGIGDEKIDDIEPAPQATPRPKSGKRTILVAEDSPIVRDLVVDALRAHGVNVVEAVDGQDAWDKLAQHPDIELLVTDIEMPRLTGLGLIQKLRAAGGRRIPAVVVSTRGSDEDKLRAVQVGADAYLVKSDFTREGLWALVSRFLG